MEPAPTTAPPAKKRSRVIPWGLIASVCVSGQMTQKEASEKFGIPVGTIAARSCREGWFKAIREAKGRLMAVPDPGKGESLAVQGEEPTAADILSEADVLKGLTEHIAEKKGKFKRNMATTLAKTAEHLVTKPSEEVFARADKVASLAKAGRDTFGEDEDSRAGGMLISLRYLRDLEPGGPGDAIEIQAEVLPPREDD